MIARTILPSENFMASSPRDVVVILRYRNVNARTHPSLPYTGMAGNTEALGHSILWSSRRECRWTARPIVFVVAIAADVNPRHCFLRLSANNLVFWRRVTIRPGRRFTASSNAARATR